MSERLMTDFSRPQSNRDWRDVMQDFDLDGHACPDYRLVEAERDDVVFHYTHFVMHEYRIGPASSTIAFGGICDVRARLGDACVAVPVLWDSTDTRTGTRLVTTGIDHLSAVYSTLEHRWRLCSSDFPNGSSTPRGHSFYSRH